MIKRTFGKEGRKKNMHMEDEGMGIYIIGYIIVVLGFQLGIAVPILNKVTSIVLISIGVIIMTVGIITPDKDKKD